MLGDWRLAIGLYLHSTAGETHARETGDAQGSSGQTSVSLDTAALPVLQHAMRASTTGGKHAPRIAVSRNKVCMGQRKPPSPTNFSASSSTTVWSPCPRSSSTTPETVSQHMVGGWDGSDETSLVAHSRVAPNTLDFFGQKPCFMVLASHSHFHSHLRSSCPNFIAPHLAQPLRQSHGPIIDFPPNSYPGGRLRHCPMIGEQNET